MTKSEDGADLVSAISATSSKKAPGSFLQAFGQRIVEARMRKGWTRVELAGEMGVSRDRLAKWERGESARRLAPRAGHGGASPEDGGLESGATGGAGGTPGSSGQVAGRDEAIAGSDNGRRRPRRETVTESVDHEERTAELLDELRESHGEGLLHLLDCQHCQGAARQRLRGGPDEARRAAEPAYDRLL